MEPVETAKRNAVTEMEMFLRNFSKVPDERLHWSPGPQANSPLRVAAHTALYAGRFAAMIRARKLPHVTDLDPWMAAQTAEEVAITSREEMERVFRAGTAAVLEALDSLKPEEVEMTLESDHGWSPSMRWLMALPGWHATLHTGQIDYLQTCWGDREIYVG